MSKCNKEAIIKLCNDINKKEGEGAIYSIGSKHANLKINRWSTGIEDLDAIIGGGMPEGRVVEIFGPEGCLAGNTKVKVHFSVDGKEGCKRKSMTIKKLYHQFNNIPEGDLRCDRFIGHRSDMMIVSMNEKDNSIISQRIADVVMTGKKFCYELKTEKGFSITCTKDHKFYVGDEYKPLSDLRVNDFVFIHKNYRIKGRAERERREGYEVKYHPSECWKNHGDNLRYCKVSRARLVVESEMNGFTFEEMLDILNNMSAEWIRKHVKIIDSSKYAIHHIDMNPLNDDISNLLVIEHEEHNRYHALMNIEKLSFVAKPDKIVSITPVGLIETYDIKCFAPNNNYVANNFVVHNSGKTTLLYHLCGLHPMCLDIPIEGTFDAERAKVFGNRPKQMLIYRAKYGEDAFNKTIKFAKAGVPLIGIDSVPSMVPKEDAEKVLKSAERDSIEEQRIGGTARLMNKYLPTVEEIIEVTGTTLIFINQVRDKMNAMLFGEKTDTPGGRKLKHACSLRIQVARKAWIEIPNKNPCNSATTEKIGLIMKCKVVKSKVSNPMGECEIPLFFDRGFVSFDDVQSIRKEIMAQRAQQFGKRIPKEFLEEEDDD